MKEITKKCLGTMTGSQAALDVFLQHVKPCASGLSADFDNLQALLPEENPEGWVEVYGSVVGKAHAAAFHAGVLHCDCKEVSHMRHTSRVCLVLPPADSAKGPSRTTARRQRSKPQSRRRGFMPA